MSRVASGRPILLFRRAYTMGNVKENGQAEASMIRKVADSSKLTEGVEKEVFWMRDPKTGNWVPETHFDEVDIAELRAKFLSKKP